MTCPQNLSEKADVQAHLVFTVYTGPKTSGANIPLRTAPLPLYLEKYGKYLQVEINSLVCFSIYLKGK